MGKVINIGLDLAKNVLVAFGTFSIQAHGAAADGAVVFRRKLSRNGRSDKTSAGSKLDADYPA